MLKVFKLQSGHLHYSWLEDNFMLRRGDQAAVAAAPCNVEEGEEEEDEEVIKMMYVGVLVDDLMVEATVAVVHIDMNSLANWQQLSLPLQKKRDCSSKTLYIALWFWLKSDFG